MTARHEFFERRTLFAQAPSNAARPVSADPPSPEVLDQHQVGTNLHLSRVQDGPAVGRHTQTQRAFCDSIERAEAPVPTGFRIHDMDWRIGARIARHVIHALRAGAKARCF